MFRVSGVLGFAGFAGVGCPRFYAGLGGGLFCIVGDALSLS